MIVGFGFGTFLPDPLKKRAELMRMHKNGVFFVSLCFGSVVCELGCFWRNGKMGFLCQWVRRNGSSSDDSRERERDLSRSQVSQEFLNCTV